MKNPSRLLTAAALMLTLCLIIPVNLVSCSDNALNDPVVYADYYDDAASLDDAFGGGLLIPAVAPEGYILTKYWLLTEKYAMLGYENNEVPIQMCAYRGESDRTNILDLPEGSYGGTGTTNIGGVEIALKYLIEAHGVQLYNATFKLGDITYIISGASMPALEAMLGSMKTPSEITDIDALRGYIRVDYADTAQLSAAIEGIPMPLPDDLPETYVPEKFYTVNGVVGVIELTNGSDTIRWAASKSDIANSYLDKYSYRKDAYTMYDNTFEIGVNNVLLDAGTPEDDTDDIVYMAQWYFDTNHSACYVLETPHGLPSAEFVKYSAAFYKVSAQSASIQLAETADEG